MNELLSKLSPLTSGQKLTTALTAERLNAIQDAIKALAAGANISASSDIKVSKSLGNVVISNNEYTNRRNIPSAVTFAYYAPGTNEIIDSIGQDPGGMTNSYGMSTFPGSDENYTVKDGGLRKLEGMHQGGLPMEGFAPILPYANPKANPGGPVNNGDTKGKFKGKLNDTCEIVPRLSTMYRSGEQIAKLVVTTKNGRRNSSTEYMKEQKGQEDDGYVTKYIEFLQPGIYEVDYDTTSMLVLDDDDPSINYHNRTITKWATLGGERDGDTDTNKVVIMPSIAHETINTSTRVTSDFQANLNFEFWLLNDDGNKGAKQTINHDVILRPAFCSDYNSEGHSIVEHEKYTHRVKNPKSGCSFESNGSTRGFRMAPSWMTSLEKNNFASGQVGGVIRDGIPGAGAIEAVGGEVDKGCWEIPEVTEETIWVPVYADGTEERSHRIIWTREHSTTLNESYGKKRDEKLKFEEDRALNWQKYGKGCYEQYIEMDLLLGQEWGLPDPQGRCLHP